MLTVLSRASAQLASAGDSFRVVGLQLPEFIEVLPHAGLDEIFVVYDVVRREAHRCAAAARSPMPGWEPTRSGSSGR